MNDKSQVEYFKIKEQYVLNSIAFGFTEELMYVECCIF